MDIIRGGSMTFKEWKTTIVNMLIGNGMEEDVAHSKANGMRGRYVDYCNYPHPRAVANEVMQKISPLERKWMKQNVLIKKKNQRNSMFRAS